MSHHFIEDGFADDLNDTAFALSLEERFSHPNGTRVWRFTRYDLDSVPLYVPIDMAALHEGDAA